MTQSWQHQPEDRPNFSTILERIDYCLQVIYHKSIGTLFHQISPRFKPGLFIIVKPWCHLVIQLTFLLYV